MSSLRNSGKLFHSLAPRNPKDLPLVRAIQLKFNSKSISYRLIKSNYDVTFVHKVISIKVFKTLGVILQCGNNK